MNPVHTLVSCCKIHFNIIIPFMPRFPKRHLSYSFSDNNTASISHLSYLRYMSLPPLHPYLITLLTRTTDQFLRQPNALNVFTFCDWLVAVHYTRTIFISILASNSGDTGFRNLVRRPSTLYFVLIFMFCRQFSSSYIRSCYVRC